MTAPSGRTLLGFAICVSGIAAGDDLDGLVSSWRAKQYDQVLPALLAYRAGAGGRTWKIDYMIGTSECHGSAHSALGAEYLSNALVYRDLPDSARTPIAKEIEFCLHQSQSGAAQEPSFEWVSVSGQVSEPAKVYGKGGFVFVEPNAPVTSGSARPSPVPVSELRARVLPAEQGDAARAAAEKRIGPAARGLVLNGFVVVCESSCEPELNVRMGNCLRNYEAPLTAEFGIEPPKSLVTVYIPELAERLPVLARRLHGVDLPLGTIAYSVVEDLSIVGSADFHGGCGSLAHELTHLSIRSTFGDSPAWLEEGLASEVAVATPHPTEFGFGESWRDDTLRRYWAERPHVPQLLQLTWADFIASNPSQLNHVAATHAMAAVFVRYLDSQGKLRAIYSNIRDHRFDTKGTQSKTSAEIVQEQLGATALQIDDAFVAWFRPTSDHTAGSPASKLRDLTR